ANRDTTVFERGSRWLCILSRPSTLLLLICVPATIAASQTRQRQARVLKAEQFPGTDLGMKVNAADKALGTSTGEIAVNGGGRIATQIVVSAGHTLRFTKGTYVTSTSLAPILLKPGAKVIGSGWDAIILESTAPNQF